MILADSNVWLALALSKHASHGTASAWLKKLKPPEIVFFCRSTQQSFLRLLTTRAVLAPYGIDPLSNQAAWAAYEGFLASDRIAWIEEPTGVETYWQEFAANSKASPKLWMDAYLAAFAMVGQYSLVTTDQAFQQFKGLQLILL